jgi:glycyl-tRNA synthetase beta subunit
MSVTHDLLFEIGCEEIPSRFLPGAMEQLKKAAAASTFRIPVRVRSD